MRQTATLVVEIIETPGVLAPAELVASERDAILDAVPVVRADERLAIGRPRTSDADLCTAACTGLCR
ncbi:hypothetical protein ACFCZ1_06125 [Streptomyces sp. NPDC056224]|uniref:hypothetical protein n=1 Tax=Streptomyces sp. NPDC056224 TaxID=3345750 RepID=UPI0035E1F4DE